MNWVRVLVSKAKTKTLWPESANELYRPSDCRLSAKLVPTFADRGCHVVSLTNSYGHILVFLDQTGARFCLRNICHQFRGMALFVIGQRT
jgi:hypothetical protein